MELERQEFINLYQKKLVILDGATGSNLFKLGMPSGVCPEKWILEHKDIMLRLQKEYVRAGSDILYAPTFTCNRIKLKEYGLENEIERMNHELVSISIKAAEGKALVAGDLTMTGEQLSPMGTMQFEELVEIYKEQIRYLEDAGADLLIVETMLSLQECRAALLAAKETCSLPVMVSLTFQEDGKTLFGTEPAAAVVVLQSLGADAVGVNCSAGPDRMLPIIKEMKKYANIPLIAKPNAGMPRIENGVTEYDMDSEVFVRHMSDLIKAGASIVGGCCGTNPDYIKKLAGIAKTLLVPAICQTKSRVLSSERRVLPIELNGKFLIVGERINPTGKKMFQQQLLNGDYTGVVEFTEEQEKRGASILDVNVGMNGIDEKQTMLEVVEEINMVSGLPLSLDSSHVDVLEEALRRYPGRALINSVSLEKEKFEKLLPIVKKYGAMFILLPLSDKGLPASLEEKITIIQTIMQEAFRLGMTKEDIIVDGLVATVGANKKAALETLETIEICKNKFGLATICGLSNISFGLPDRSYVNSAFLTLAISKGLTMAISNPSQELLVRCAYAADLLMNKEGSDLEYIKMTQRLKPNVEQQAEEMKTGMDSKKVIYRKVLLGDKKEIAAETKKAVEEGEAPSVILNEVLIPAINEVGEKFDKQIYFLPQLIASAEAMKRAIEYLEPMLAKEKNKKELPAIVIATVQGDIHDIGKNLVALMLKNYGYRIIDLGKDVSKEKIVSAAMENNAQIIALSALMTTTMQEMRNVIAYAKKCSCTAKIMIGGAVITQEYADEIGADGYSKDAADAVKLVERLLAQNSEENRQ